jgi:hypothetical protein
VELAWKDKERKGIGKIRSQDWIWKEKLQSNSLKQ